MTTNSLQTVRADKPWRQPRHALWRKTHLNFWPLVFCDMFDHDMAIDQPTVRQQHVRNKKIHVLLKGIWAKPPLYSLWQKNDATGCIPIYSMSNLRFGAHNFKLCENVTKTQKVRFRLRHAKKMFVFLGVSDFASCRGPWKGREHELSADTTSEFSDRGGTLRRC